jgi:hypothetical protein
MSGSLLNQNQRRHVATHVHLLLDDLAQLAQLAELASPGEPYRKLREALDEVEASAQEMVAELDLPPRRAHGAKQHVLAAASVWGTRIYELNAKRLRAYGTVHGDLAEHLDPLVTKLRERLMELGEAAQELPED